MKVGDICMVFFEYDEADWEPSTCILLEKGHSGFWKILWNSRVRVMHSDFLGSL